MHNGVYRTLQEVVDFYDRGGGAGIGITLANRTLSSEALHLSRAEKRELVAFMRALTDSVGTSSARPR
jgi:cytochrome c peroxidase